MSELEKGASYGFDCLGEGCASRLFHATGEGMWLTCHRCGGTYSYRHLSFAEGERAATERIVKWLEDQPAVALLPERVRPYVRKLAEAIERGEHNE